MPGTVVQTDKDPVPTKKQTQFDYLRALAAVAVIVIHVCAMEWRRLDINTAQWAVIHITDQLCKFSVPVFFMISGRFFLDPERPVPARKLAGKILRLATAFVFWSLIYTGINVLRVVYPGESLENNAMWILMELVSGEYHMWFLYAIASLYLVTPVLRCIVKEKKITEYFLWLFLIFGTVLETAKLLPKIGGVVSMILYEANFHLVLGFSGYFVLGYYLHTYPVTKRTRNICYLLGIVGSAVSVSVTWLMSDLQGSPDETFAGYLTPNVAFAAIAVYLYAQEHLTNKQPGKIVKLLSDNSFGIYLAHPMVLWVFEWIGLTPAASSPVVMIPIITFAAVAISLPITILCKRIPKLGKYIV